eukprot:gene20518-24629_t
MLDKGCLNTLKGLVGWGYDSAPTMKKYMREAKEVVKSTIGKGNKTEGSTSPPPPSRMNGDLSRKELKKVTKRKTLAHPVFYIKFAKGFLTFFKGALTSIRNRQIMSTYYETLQLLMVGIAGTYFALIMSTLPIRIGLFVLAKFGLHLESLGTMLSPFVLFDKIALFVPMIFVGFLRYMLPSYNEDMFFSVMAVQNPVLAEHLRNSPIVKQYPFSDYLKRLGKMAFFGVSVYLMSLLPYVGTVIIPISQFIYSREPLGNGMAFVLSVTSLHPSFKSFASHSLKALMASYSLAKELLEVYYCRVPDAKQEVYINRRYFGWLFGFSIACMYCLSIPYIGVSLWGIAQGSAAVFVLQILERNAQKQMLEHDGVIHLYGEEHVDAKIKSM